MDLWCLARRLLIHSSLVYQEDTCSPARYQYIISTCYLKMSSNSLACCAITNEDRLKMVTGSQTYQAIQNIRLSLKSMHNRVKASRQRHLSLQV
jgi:hypothetical protein